MQLHGVRREEALATPDDEGCSHELALHIHGPDGPLIMYAMEAERIEKSPGAADDSTHPIDEEHRAVMARSIGEHPSLKWLLNLQR